LSILLVLIPVTLLFVVAGGMAFFWAVNHDQFDDMETPGLQPLADSEPDLEAGLPAVEPRFGSDD
jgi:cbb3-type cytochrome oxidase maturation protein